MKVISKTKEKGKEFGTKKKMKKKKRLMEEKTLRDRTENKRINAENRKARALREEELEKINAVKIVDFVKGMLIINLEDQIEKRALIFDKEDVNLKNYKDKIHNFEVKIYGELIKISKLKNFKEVEEELIWKIEEMFV